MSNVRRGRHRSIQRPHILNNLRDRSARWKDLVKLAFRSVVSVMSAISGCWKILCMRIQNCILKKEDKLMLKTLSGASFVLWHLGSKEQFFVKKELLCATEWNSRSPGSWSRVYWIQMNAQRWSPGHYSGRCHSTSWHVAKKLVGQATGCCHSSDSVQG